MVKAATTVPDWPGCWPVASAYAGPSIAVPADAVSARSGRPAILCWDCQRNGGSAPPGCGPRGVGCAQQHKHRLRPTRSACFASMAMDSTGCPASRPLRTGKLPDHLDPGPPVARTRPTGMRLRCALCWPAAVRAVPASDDPPSLSRMNDDTDDHALLVDRVKRGDSAGLRDAGGQVPAAHTRRLIGRFVRDVDLVADIWRRKPSSGRTGRFRSFGAKAPFTPGSTASPSTRPRSSLARDIKRDPVMTESRRAASSSDDDDEEPIPSPPTN